MRDNVKEVMTMISSLGDFEWDEPRFKSRSAATDSPLEAGARRTRPLAGQSKPGLSIGVHARAALETCSDVRHRPSRQVWSTCQSYAASRPLPSNQANGLQSQRFQAPSDRRRSCIDPRSAEGHQLRPACCPEMPHLRVRAPLRAQRLPPQSSRRRGCPW